MAGKKSDPRGSYGIAEWYGRLYRTLDDNERREFLKPADKIACRFMLDTPALAPAAGTHCNKKGGVCSLRSFVDDNTAGVRFGEITATCPNRFLEDGLIIRTIGETLLDTPSPLLAKEIPFLKRVAYVAAGEAEAEQYAGHEDVGRIDMVCVHPDLDNLEWCAVEMQAVYFSGGAMSKDFKAIETYTGDSVPMPGVRRRPDFRSSGPKRLMPQLQIKVPTLRRWGKKMAVVVDEPFFKALGPMESVSDVSNCDIVWIVVRIDDREAVEYAAMSVAFTRFTTLERAVEGLTAGIPTTLSDFESKLCAKLGDDRPG